MTTTIVPGSGAGVLYTQQGVGTTPGYSALDARRTDAGSLQEGVLNPLDFAVAQRSAGANMSVDIGMPSGGCAKVQGDTIAGQGLYTVPVHSSSINEPIAPADPTNPRVDIVILEVQDNVLDASGGNLARTRVVPGTPTATASLSNRLGAPTLPANALLLADVLVPNGSSTVTTGNIGDRRKYARYTFGSVTPGGSVTAAGGQFILAQPGATVTLPPASLNADVLVLASTGVSAASPVTVTYGTGGGALFGVGMSNVGSLQLGTPSAWVLLHCYDGINWAVVGQQDSGWLALTGLASGVTSGGYGASARLRGDTVQLKGTLTNTTGSQITGTIATVPSGLRPGVTLSELGQLNAQITTGGAVSVLSGGGLNASAMLALDGIVYTLS